MENFENISISAIYKRRKSDRDIFQELMPNKVKEVLLFATLYDSYAIEREGQFSDKIFGEYLQLNLYAAPRFTSINTQEEVNKVLNSRHFDLVIIMAGVDKELPLKIVAEINTAKPRIPILLLVNNNSDVRFFKIAATKIPAIDRVFVWNGNSNVFLAMIKYIEDKKNVAKDTRLGGVRIILLVEDSIKYYSRYLPLLFASVMTQTQALVSDESTDELHKIFKYRARPKVLLVSTYEGALQVIHEYKEYLLCVISDVKFSRNGINDEDAGIELLKFVKQHLRYPIPLLLQSHDVSNSVRADKIQAGFINKNSDTLSHDINTFINSNLGFGNFVFRDGNGNPIGVASNLHEFEELVKTVPVESLVYHGRSNDFSTWLMARGEINIAERLIPYKTEEFDDPSKIRDICLRIFDDVQEKRNRGRIINFDPLLVNGNRYIVRMGRGSLGGKGRGLAFMCNMMENIDMKALLPGINIRMPATAIIGAIEFDKFLETNDLYDVAYHQTDFKKVNEAFLNATLSSTLKERLLQYVRHVKQPLAVRSSGLFEDSLLRPFSGVYSTFLIPNSHPDENVRFEQLRTAVKLVYASVFSDEARAYFNAINYKIEEEKMAVILQPVVGQEHNQKFYSDISGVAQSFNYYPYSYMEPDDGFAVIAVGLGQAVVGGEKAYRFCPKYPALNNNSVQDQIRDSQRDFYAIDMAHNSFDLTMEGEMAAIRKYKISEAEKDGALEHCASTYSIENDYISPGIGTRGPRVINFANILEYQHVPLADTLMLLMKLFKLAMGSPVEMEYAIDLNSGENGWPTFYLLQLKPLIRREEDVEIELGALDSSKLLLLSNKGMGNGKVSGISDVVYVDIKRFDRTKTREIANEIAEVNKAFTANNRKYVLIGPGRWGTRDEYTGIPVNWANINNAKVIVEIGLPNYPLDGSLGSHFFHNVTSMNVGYFSIPDINSVDFVKLDLLDKQDLIWEGKYVRHVRFKNELEILMDGRKRTAVIRI
ncbi:MAG TPA: PEP/pyruvate-binding domain-containing protein [Prolixibacteraceae bacterium]|nr:PEP/pyruvate-binding domain-containing protein [Prolixibacteraceae bacterium]